MSNLIQVSDLIVEFLESKKSTHVFLLSGGMMMHLLDSVSKSEKISYVCNHHEQASSIAAESFARVKNCVGVCFATSGPGATNTITGIAGSWLDSTPVMYFTGQSRTTLTTRGIGINELRMCGNFEVNIVDIVKPITKYSVFVDDPNTILYHLEKAYYLATNGRPGPVLLDIPLDVQGAKVEISELIKFKIPISDRSEVGIDHLIDELKKSNRPLILAGHGIRVANQVDEFRKIIADFNIPVVLTQLANDLMPYDDDLYIGKVGLRGDRAGNFAIQSADLLITIGTSLHITTTGYDLNKFAPNAKKIVVDIDEAILRKNVEISDYQINCDVKDIICALNKFPQKFDNTDWIIKLKTWKHSFSIMKEPHESIPGKINTYNLLDVLSDCMSSDEVLISDAGSLYYVIGQAFRSKLNQRVIISGALGAMGYALPASIGAAFASPEKNIICLTGDGSIHLNIQELQTIRHHDLNCKIVLINNNGYASIRNSQSAFLNGRTAGSSQATGVSLPDWDGIARAYAINYIRAEKMENLSSVISAEFNKKGPVIIEIVIPENVVMIPSVTSTMSFDGKFKSNMLHEMSPLLSNIILSQNDAVINIDKN